jgi:putative colanic acid biosynthesis acetyltransferase WcaF
MAKDYPVSNRVGRFLWSVVYTLLFRFSPRPLHRWRCFLLRCFGAKLGSGCHIYASARIWAPWNLQCGSRACIADHSEVYNPAAISLGEGVVISQGAFLCTASHDYVDPEFPLIHGTIVVGRRAWVAARAIVLMGVTIGEGSVVAAGSVVTKDVPANVVCAGNPARVVKNIKQ